MQLLKVFHTIKRITSNLEKTTASRFYDNFESSVDTGLEDFQQGRKKTTSFDNKKIFSDAKFRFAYELHNAGIQRTAYAFAAVKELITRQTERTTGIEPA